MTDTSKAFDRSRVVRELATCRELALSSSTRQATIVGCRTEEAAWTMAALVQFAGPAGGSDDAFAPASGPATELDEFVNSLMAGIPLSAAAEREAISSGWQ